MSVLLPAVIFAQQLLPKLTRSIQALLNDHIFWLIKLDSNTTAAQTAHTLNTSHPRTEDDTLPSLVQYTLDGHYDDTRPVLIDAATFEDPAIRPRQISLNQASDLVSRLTGIFQEGTTVCMHLENDITYTLVFLGILASGCRWTGTNPAYTARELAHHFTISGTRYVITSAQHLPCVSAAIQAAQIDAEIIIYSDILDSDSRNMEVERRLGMYRYLHDLIRPTPPVYVPKVDPDSVAVLMPTSGTTGAPKVAARTHRALVLQAMASYDNDAEKSYPVRRLYCTPIFHAFTGPQMLIEALRLGHPTYFMKRYNKDFARNIEKFNITETAGTPAMLIKLCELPLDERKLLASLRQIICAGAVLPEKVRTDTLNIFGDKPPRIVQNWGMTEGGWFATFKYPENDTTGSVGRLLPFFDLKVDDSHPVPTTTANGLVSAGELLIRGPQLMQGYLANEAASASAFDADGYLRTGDIGYQDSSGRIFLVDRAKDLIKVNGWQVSPSEMQAVLLCSPLVAEAAVIKRQDEQSGNELPVAFVVPKREGVMAEEIKRYLKSQMASYKASRCEVRLVTGIAKNAMGKVVKDDLVRQL